MENACENMGVKMKAEDLYFHAIYFILSDFLGSLVSWSSAAYPSARGCKVTSSSNIDGIGMG